MDMVWNIFFMFGGVAVMMFGMKLMGGGLEHVAGGGMKKMLGKITTNRFAGVGVGIAVTSIIQSFRHLYAIYIIVLPTLSSRSDLTSVGWM